MWQHINRTPEQRRLEAFLDTVLLWLMACAGNCRGSLLSQESIEVRALIVAVLVVVLMKFNVVNVGT